MWLDDRTRVRATGRRPPESGFTRSTEGHDLHSRGIALASRSPCPTMDGGDEGRRRAETQVGGNMHSNTESGSDGHAAFVRSTASVTSASASSTEPQLADTITGQRETAGQTVPRYADKECDDGRRLSPEREARIRRRLLDGSYNSLSMVDALARRLIRSADL